MDIFRVLDENQISILNEIRHVCVQKKIKVYMVGGVVRDSILNLKTKDIDVCIEENPLKVIKSLKTLKDYVYYEKFQTSTIQFNNGVTVDLIRCRKEIYIDNGNLPIVEPSYIEDDLHRRDFTINALAYDLVEEKIIDLYGGIKHIENKILKSIHENSYEEDPTRIFRVIRYSTRYGFKVEEENAIKGLIKGGIFDTISYDRYIKELYLICGEKKWISMLKNCCEYGIINLNIEKLGRRNMLCSGGEYVYINFLNMVYCSKDKNLNNAVLQNSFLSKEHINPVRKFILNKREIETRLLHARSNYDIYNILKGMTDYELILLSWNDSIKYKVYNYISNVTKYDIKVNGSEIKKIIKKDGKIVGQIKQFILRKNVNMLIDFNYDAKNIGEILYDIEHKHR